MRGPSMSFKVRALLAVFGIALLAPGAKAFAAPGPTFAALRSAGAKEVRDVYVRLPQTPATGQPLQVLMAFHGMGGNGRDFGSALAAQADLHGWMIVAPTIGYGDWTNPDQVAREDPALIAWLSDYINHLGDGTGVAVQPQVLMFGHSRGAQLALRFTEVHPEQVAGVAAVSAGTYTLPLDTDAQTGQPLPFPFGIADLAQSDGGAGFNVMDFDSVPIWVGVGARDNSAGDVPRQWDPYIGPDRLDRAENFTQTLQDLGANVSLTVFPNTDHTLTDDMRITGCNALATDVS